MHYFKTLNVVEMFENVWKRQLVNRNYCGILFKNLLTLYRVVWQQFIGEVGTGEVWMSYRLQKNIKVDQFSRNYLKNKKGRLRGHFGDTL